MGRGGQAWVKREVYKGDQKMGSVGERRKGGGRGFQSQGAVLKKALSLKVLSLGGGTVRVREEEDLRVGEG